MARASDLGWCMLCLFTMLLICGVLLLGRDYEAYAFTYAYASAFLFSTTALVVIAAALSVMLAHASCPKGLKMMLFCISTLFGGVLLLDRGYEAYAFVYASSSAFLPSATASVFTLAALSFKRAHASGPLWLKLMLFCICLAVWPTFAHNYAIQFSLVLPVCALGLMASPGPTARSFMVCTFILLLAAMEAFSPSVAVVPALSALIPYSLVGPRTAICSALYQLRPAGGLP